MALAVRMRMVTADKDVLESIVVESVSKALDSAKRAEKKVMSSGNA